MQMWLYLDSDNRILASTDTEEFAEGMEPYDMPDDFDFSKQDQYVMQDGAPVYSKRPLTPEQQAAKDARDAETERQETLSLLPDAVADLSETVSTNETDLTDVNNAIAELSELVSELMSTTTA